MSRVENFQFNPGTKVHLLSICEGSSRLLSEKEVSTLRNRKSSGWKGARGRRENTRNDEEEVRNVRCH